MSEYSGSLKRYMNEICLVDLVTPKEEIYLAGLIKEGVQARKEIEQARKQDMPPREMDAEERDLMVRSTMPLVPEIADETKEPVGT